MIKGKITDIKEDGTAVITVQLNLADYIRKDYKDVYVEPIDSRPLSDKQRRMCYALMNAIAEWSGNEPEDIKEYFKMEFWANNLETLADKLFSLSNAPMDLIVAFQKFLIKFIISNDVPVKRPLLEYVDDIDDYVYMCLIHKKCAICGKKGELHHIDTVGMGNDRTEIQHEGREAMSLCREHHTEYHTIGKSAFLDKYHLNGGIKIDKTILKIYGLKK